MTERKFTPPTEFPAEYVTEEGWKAVILGRAPVGGYPLIGYSLHAEDGSDCSSPQGWAEDGQYYTDRPSSEDLHDIPKRITTWHNVYSDFTGGGYKSREIADRNCDQSRLCVYRIEQLAATNKELEAKLSKSEALLAKALGVAEKSIEWLWRYGADVHKEAAILAELPKERSD